MAFTVTIARHPHYVRFDVAGQASLQNYADLIDDAGRQTAAAGDRRALVQDPGSYDSVKVAHRHGFELRGFNSDGEALAWLLAPGELR